MFELEGFRQRAAENYGTAKYSPTMRLSKSFGSLYARHNSRGRLAHVVVLITGSLSNLNVSF
jgi:hypothetical protein